MSEYYTMIIAVAILSMIAMSVCVGISGTMSRKKKIYFRLLFLCISVAAFCEWLGLYLQNTGKSTVVLHIAVKAIELSIAPAIGFLIAAVIEVKFQKIIIGFLAVQAFFEVLSGFFGFIYQVDGNSYYTHRSFYWIYIASFVVSILYALFIVFRNMKRYQYNGIAFLCMITACLIFGIGAQLINGTLMVVYISVAIVAIMLYVFTLEMIQQNDELTGLINRRGYENHIAHIEDKCVILMFDIDRFKSINDTYGHSTGDLCLKKVGKALVVTYAKYGKCFRVGGDEFCVILTKNLDAVGAINKEFFALMEEYRKKDAWLPNTSIGYEFFNPVTDSIQDAVAEADRLMYQCKERNENRLNR